MLCHGQVYTVGGNIETGWCLGHGYCMIHVKFWSGSKPKRKVGSGN
jgi:hypothetical protein